MMNTRQKGKIDHWFRIRSKLLLLCTILLTFRHEKIICTSVFYYALHFILVCSGKQTLKLNDLGYFEVSGLNVMAFQDIYPEGHQVNSSHY